MNPESAVQQLAATLLAKEITPDLLTTLQEPDTAKLLTHIEPNCAELLEKEWTSQDFEDAAVEFCRLFILNPAVPARAAAWFEEDSLAIASRIQFMLDHGFLELPPSFQNLAPDHVALLLLIHTSVAGDDARQFAQDNLDPWIPQFAAALTEKAQHPLYSLAAKLISL